VLGEVSDGEGVKLVSDGSTLPMPHGFEHRV
jgi:hypothetical protein